MKLRATLKPVKGRQAGPKVTPAMAAGIADHVWTCEEIAALLD